MVQGLEKVLFAHQPHLFAVPVRRAVDAFPRLGWRWDRLGNFEYSNGSPDKSRGDPSKEGLTPHTIDSNMTWSECQSAPSRGGSSVPSSIGTGSGASLRLERLVLRTNSASWRAWSSGDEERRRWVADPEINL